MFNMSMLMICVFSSLILGDSTSQKTKRVFKRNSRFDSRLGIHIASDTLIQEYENEHKMMHRKEDGTIDDAEYLQWPSKLADKNLTEYCGQFLKMLVPKRHVCNMFGEPEPVQIFYLTEECQFKYNIGAIRCEIPSSDSRINGKSYYMTEAPQRECVYTLKRLNRGKSPLQIVSKVCGFESNDSPNFIYSNIRRKDRRRTMSKIHSRTGIPITLNNVIADYEYKHQQMYKKDDGSIDIDKYTSWPLNRSKTYLSHFCDKYLKAIVPSRVKLDHQFGEVDQIVLQYTQQNLISLRIGIIRCVIPSSKGGRKETLYYYITESPEPDCVYTLLRPASIPICNIVYQICGIYKSGKGLEAGTHLNPTYPFINGLHKWELKSNLDTLINMDFNSLPEDNTEKSEPKPDLKTFSFFPEG